MAPSRYVFHPARVQCVGKVIVQPGPAAFQLGVGYVGDGSGHQVDHLLPLGCIGLGRPVNAQRLVQ